MLIIPKKYDPVLTIRQTQDAIKYVRDVFQKEIAKELNLERISAPMFVPKDTGLNDDLNGVERKVSFDLKDIKDSEMEIVQSLAKWKRDALHRYGFEPGSGLYTNMNAIRRDEDLDNIHSCYVDQWDWEKVITKEERTMETLEATVRTIFKVVKYMEHVIWYKYPEAVYKLADDVTFIDSEELLKKYPNKTPKERENLIAKEYGCVFIKRIGEKLSNGDKEFENIEDAMEEIPETSEKQLVSNPSCTYIFFNNPESSTIVSSAYSPEYFLITSM